MATDQSQQISNCKVLVTGGAGFIGSNLCEVLLAQHNEVVCLDNYATGYRENIAALLEHKNFTFIEGDIRNIEDCRKAVQGCDYVLHQAALGSVPRSIKDPMTSTNVNIGGFVNMLTAAKDEGVKRFVYAASSSTYGDSRELPKVEHRIGNPLSPYAITKLVDEFYAKNFSELYGIETIGLRYFNVFGRKQTTSGAYAAVIPNFVKALIEGRRPTINGDGSYSRDFTYIDNVIHANQIAAITPTEVIRKNQEAYYASQDLACPAQDSTLNELFNVAHGERTNLLELLNYLKANLSQFDAAIADIEPIFGPTRKGDVPHSLASIDKNKSLLNYQPKYSVKEGIELATTWYWENLK